MRAGPRGEEATADRIEQIEPHRVLRGIAIGRAVVTIERTDAQQEGLPECLSADALNLSIYSDPDVSAVEQPVCLYLVGGRYGMASAHLQIFTADGRQRIFKMEERVVRGEF